MKAVVQDGYGLPGALKLRDVGVPAIGDDGVLVRVHAASVDPAVWHFASGTPYLARLVGGLRGPRGRVLGSDVSGQVAAVGANVTGLKEGDQVFGTCDGSLAEYAKSRPHRLVTKPAELSHEQAAAVPVSAITALQALRDRGGLIPGQKLLILGAGGGVGSFAVQIGKALGAEVTGVCSTAKLRLVRSLGATHVIDYTKDGLAEQRERFDLIVDVAGRHPIAGVKKLLAPGGAVVFVGAEGGGRWLGGSARLAAIVLMAPFQRHRMRPFIARVRREDLLYLKDLLETGALAPVIDQVYPLDRAQEAVQQLGEGHARGKIVVSVLSS
jgi:NADPH:quinone reductase-like Zn-dependent oxidoreductase